MKPTTPSRAETELFELLSQHAISMTAQHVPSEYDPRKPAGERGMIDWRVTLQKNAPNGPQFTTEYHQGIGHLPEQVYSQRDSRMTIYRLEIINKALKTGRTPIGHKLTPPSIVDVIGALAHDTEALEMTFEDFASSHGYDTDSRKAEQTYNACRESGLALLRVLGAALLEKVKPLTAEL